MLPIKDFQLQLFVGLSKDFYISSSRGQFLIDLKYDQVLMDITPFTCNLNINCQNYSENIDQDSYNQKQYSYKKSKIFYSWERISPAEINDLDQFNFLRSFDFRNVIMDAKNKKPHKGNRI